MMRSPRATQSNRRGHFAPGVIALLTALLTGLLLAGCDDSANTKMSPQDQANFKGGPMPAGYKDPTMPGNAPPPAAATKK